MGLGHTFNHIKDLFTRVMHIPNRENLAYQKLSIHQINKSAIRNCMQYKTTHRTHIYVRD